MKSPWPIIIIAIGALATILLIARTFSPPPAAIGRYEFRVADGGILWRLDHKTGHAFYCLPGSGAGRGTWIQISDQAVLDLLPATDIFGGIAVTNH